MTAEEPALRSSVHVSRKQRRKVSRHVAQVTQSLPGNSSMLRHAPGRARTYSPKIRSHIVPSSEIAGKGNSIRKPLKNGQDTYQGVFSKRCKCLIKNNLPRMDSNRDKVMQSLLWELVDVIGYDPL